MLESAGQLGNRRSMNALSLHPDCTAGPIAAVSATVEHTSFGCRATFLAKGEMGAVIVPQAARPERRDNLWQTTCFEIFWQTAGAPDIMEYWEFNLSPSTQWAAYHFDDRRLNPRNEAAKVVIECQTEADTLMIEAEISLDLPIPANAALNAIIEDTSGNIQFWALAFGQGKADFHDPVCRSLRIEGPSA